MRWNPLSKSNIQTLSISVMYSFFFHGKALISLSSVGNVIAVKLTVNHYFLLCLSLLSYGTLMFFLLNLAKGKWKKYKNEISLFLLFASLYNFIDPILYFLMGRSMTVRLVSFFLGALYLPLSIWAAMRLASAQRIKNIQLILIPIFLVLFCNAFILFGYLNKPIISIRSITKDYKVGTKLPVHLIIMDGLSWDVFFQGNQINPQLKNFQHFSRNTHIFLNAKQLGERTISSLGQMITGKRFSRVEYDERGWLTKSRNEEPFSLIKAEGTFFQDAIDNGYNNFLIGFYLPYLRQFQSLIQHGKSIPIATFSGRILQRFPRFFLCPEYFSVHKNLETAFEYYLSDLKTSPSNVFYYVHLNQPHNPYPYTSEGRLLGRLEFFRQQFSGSQKENYFNSVLNLDHKFGLLLTTLKELGRYDSSMIIITSDHNFLDYETKKVPLLVKLPYQQTSYCDTEEIDMTYLKNFLAAFFKDEKADINLLFAEPKKVTKL